MDAFIKGEYDIVEVSIKRPFASVIQQGSSFNFDDLIERFTGSDSTTVKDSGDEIHFRIENIHIDSARIRYQETTMNSALTFINAVAKCPLIKWNEPVHHYELSTGSLQSSLDIDIKTLLYSLSSYIKEVNLSPFLPYVQDALKINKMDGLISLQFELKGNINQPTTIALQADNKLENFSLLDFQNDELTKVNVLNFGIDFVNTKENIYDWGH